MASSLIRGKYVVARVASRTEVEVIPDGAVFQRDGVIVEMGRHADLAARHRHDDALGPPDHVVVPGFVNGHHHVGLTPFQLGSPDYALELWFASRMAARAVDPYLDTLYSAFEMLESGITTVQHPHGWRIGPAAKVIGVADRASRPGAIRQPAWCDVVGDCTRAARFTVRPTNLIDTDVNINVRMGLGGAGSGLSPFTRAASRRRSAGSWGFEWRTSRAACSARST